MKRTKYSDTKKTEIVAYAAKHGKREASRKFICSEQSIYNWISSGKYVNGHNVNRMYNLFSAAEDCKKIQEIINNIPEKFRRMVSSNIDW